MRTAISLAILFLVSCKCPKEAVGTANYEAQKNGLTPILSESYGGGDEEYLEVIQTQGELQKFFARVNKTRKPGIPVPKVDFEQQQVIVYCAGKQQGAVLPELVPLQDKEEQLLLGVKAKKEVNQPDTAVTTPFIVYSMPRTEREVVLRKGGTP
jgi:hypothetical protein